MTAGVSESFSFGLRFSVDSCDFRVFVGAGVLVGEVSSDALDVLRPVLRHHFLLVWSL